MTQLIETLRAEADGSLPLLDVHMQRLQTAAAALGYVCPCGNIRQALLRCAQSLPADAHRLRLLLWDSGIYTLESTPLPPLPALPGVAVAQQALDSTDPWLRYKSTQRPRYQAAAQWLSEHPGLFDVVYFNARDELCEGSRTNVYLQLADGQWYTPPVECGLLPGVQRQVLLERGQVHTRVLTRQDWRQAKCIRLSNALRGWFDVQRSELRYLD